MLKPLTGQTEADIHLRSQLIDHLDLKVATHLTQGFVELVQRHQPEQLNSWLAQAKSGNLKQFQRFAEGLEEDYAAVKAGSTLPISNGQVEGQVNRLRCSNARCTDELS